MLGACVLMVLGAETWLLVALVPGRGRQHGLPVPRPPAATSSTWPGGARRDAVARLPDRPGVHAKERLRAPATCCSPPNCGRPCRPSAFGVVAAGLLTFPIVAGPHGHGGLNRGALLVSLPLSLSMGAAEWSLLWYRRRMRRLLGSTTGLRGVPAACTPCRCSSRCCSTCAARSRLCVAGVTVAAWAGFAHPGRADLPVMVAYLMLGSAMFLALLLQTMRVRAVPLAAAAAALAIEIALRDTGMVIQVLTPAVCSS